MTVSLTDFISRAGNPKHIEEAYLAASYAAADKKLVEAKIDLIDHLGAAEVDGKIVPTFDDEVAGVVPDLERAKKEAVAVKNDISKYLECLGDCQSIAQLTERLGHLKIIVRNAEFSAKNILEREVKSSGKSSGECMVASVVTDAYAHADRLSKENQPKIDDLLSRIKEAREILEKY